MDASPDFAFSSGLAAVPVPTAFDPEELRGILANLSHDLCRPLISLRAGIELLQPVAPEQREHVATMAALCDDLLRLTRGYLDYAGLVQGARPLALGAFTISALVREIDRAFASTAAERGTDWECLLEGPDASVTTDASRCQEIFENVVANALKYTPEGGRIRVVGRRDRDHWLVTVTDTGPGIPSESVGKVFEPFYRLARDERLGISGCGLGLAICRALVAQMGGVITITSEEGQGTRVAIRFPIEANRCIEAPSGRE